MDIFNYKSITSQKNFFLKLFIKIDKNNILNIARFLKKFYNIILQTTDNQTNFYLKDIIDFNITSKINDLKIYSVDYKIDEQIK